MSTDAIPAAGEQSRHRLVPPKPFLVLLAALLVTPPLLVGAYEFAYSGRVLPGVRIHDVEVGAEDRVSAVAAVQQRIDAFRQMPVSLVYGERTWQIPLQEVGASWSIDDAVSLALQAGRDGSLRDTLLDQWRLLRAGASVPVAASLDESQARRFLNTIAQRIDTPAQDAQLRIQGTDVTIGPAATGTTLDQDEALRQLRDRLAALSDEPIVLRVTTLSPAMQEADLRPLQDQARQALGQAVTLRFEGTNWDWDGGPVARPVRQQWDLKPQTFAPVLTVHLENGRPTLAVDGGKAADIVDQYEQRVAQAPRDTRLALQGNRVVPVVVGREKRWLDRDEFLKRLGPAILGTGEARVMQLPVLTEKPSVALQDVSGMDFSRVIEERSTYYGDSVSERAFNVELGAKRLNGVVVAPGQTFSFNQAVGEVTERSGYKLGFAIIGGETSVDPGGGICQVSTTLFQSVFWSGYSIAERYPHSYRITRYENPYAGLDATVFDPYVDFKWVNDGPSYILIEAWADGERMHVALHGQKPDWSVQVDEPRVTNRRPADTKVIVKEEPALAKGREVWVEHAEDGADIAVRRTVRRGSQVLRQADFFSSYQPQRNLKLVGTGGA